MKNKIISILVLVCMMFALPLTGYALSGKGTEANPFRITNEDELLLLADFPDCYFELENDIELTKTWEPVADFSGSFDGKGHTITISGFVIKTNTGFFGTLSGTVKNLEICANKLSMDLNWRSTPNYFTIGIFAGNCKGLISNCKVSGEFSIKTTDDIISMGGICGSNNGIIEKTIVEFQKLKFHTYRNEMSSSYENTAGGICATLAGTITECVNISNVELIGSEMSCLNYGGFIGSSTKTASVSNSYNKELIITVNGSNRNYAGVVYNNGGQVVNCFSASGNPSVGKNQYGIAKNTTTGTITSSYYDKVVIGNTSTAYGEPKSTIAMKMEATYKNWDFENIWGLDESEENPINDGYPYLRHFYADHKNPATDSVIKVVDGKLVVDTKIAEANEDYIVHIALYGEENRLCGYIIVPNERELKDVFVVYPDDGKAQFAKVFTWYSTDTMVPVSDCETITIER